MAENLGITSHREEKLNDEDGYVIEYANGIHRIWIDKRTFELSYAHFLEE